MTILNRTSFTIRLEGCYSTSHTATIHSNSNMPPSKNFPRTIQAKKSCVSNFRMDTCFPSNNCLAIPLHAFLSDGLLQALPYCRSIPGLKEGAHACQSRGRDDGTCRLSFASRRL